MRCAIIYSPPPNTSLMQTASAWMRRDVHTGAAVTTEIEGLTDRDHAFITALPRRFGFHARLKSPFRLAAGKSVSDVHRHLQHFCAPLSPLPFSLRLTLLGDMFALVLPRRSAEIDMLAARVVTEFDGFRLADGDGDGSSVADADQRLNGRQLSNLMMWGEPDVFDQFSFHMMLTGPIERRERPHVERVILRHFREALEKPHTLASLCLSVETEPLGPHTVHAACAFGLKTNRKIA